VPCVGRPNGTDNNDCSNSLQVCSSAPIATVSTGPGIQSEGCTGGTCPAGGENHTNWYYIVMQTSGTFNFNIVPNVGTDDFDFIFYGPNVTCSALGAPIRCSDAGVTGTTGLGGGATDVVEDVTGDGWLAPMNVTAGDVYVLSVDRWSPGGNGYTLNFGGTASLDCTPLPVELIDFTANYNKKENIVDLYWHTQSEINSDYFIIETSTDGKNYKKLSTIDGAGNTAYETEYITFDTKPVYGTNYYKLIQVDMQGNKKELKTISVFVDKNIEYSLKLQPNPANTLTTIEFQNKRNETVEIIIYDYLGNIVYKQPYNSIDGVNKYKLNIESFIEGMYMVTIVTSSTTIKGKLIKH